MNCRPVSLESLAELKQLQEAAESRGDHCLALLLSGVELYTRLGREFELLEIMRKFADEIHDAVQNTPSAKELERLFHLSPEPPTPPQET
jgi:hypothetical protein